MLFQNKSAIHEPTRTVGANQEDKDQISKNLRSSPTRNKIIPGNLHAQIEKENFNREVAGRFTKHEKTNDNGTNKRDNKIIGQAQTKSEYRKNTERKCEKEICDRVGIQNKNERILNNALKE